MPTWFMQAAGIWNITVSYYQNSSRNKGYVSSIWSIWAWSMLAFCRPRQRHVLQFLPNKQEAGTEALLIRTQLPCYEVKATIYLPWVSSSCGWSGEACTGGALPILTIYTVFKPWIMLTLPMATRPKCFRLFLVSRPSSPENLQIHCTHLSIIDFWTVRFDAIFQKSVYVLC